MSISEREGPSAGVEVYSPFLDLVTASCWEAGTCGRSPSVLWIYQEEEINILSGQLEYVPMLKNAQAIYTAPAGRVCLRFFFFCGFGWFGWLWFFVLFGFFLSSLTAYNDWGSKSYLLESKHYFSGTEQCLCMTTGILKTAPLSHSMGLPFSYIDNAKRPGNRILWHYWEFSVPFWSKTETCENTFDHLHTTTVSSVQHSWPLTWIWRKSKIHLEKYIKRSARKGCHLLPYQVFPTSHQFSGMIQTLLQTSAHHHSLKHFLCPSVQKRKIIYSELCRFQLGNLKLHEN